MTVKSGLRNNFFLKIFFHPFFAKNISVSQKSGAQTLDSGIQVFF